MDLNPTFGREELVETFSQNSGTNSRGSNHNNQSQHQQQHRRRTGETSSSSSDQHEQQQRNSSSNNNKSSSSSSTEHQRRLQRNARIQQQQRSAVLQQQQQNVDDAVRRLGYRLSIQAHGGDYHTATSSSGSGSHHYTASRSGDAYGYASSSTSHGAQGQLQLPPKPPFEHHPETSCFTEVANTLVNDDTGARGAATNDQRNSNDNTSNSRLIEDTEGGAGTASLPVDAQPFRTMKVAKMNYHDQGDKQLAIVTGTSSKSILRKLTMECKDWFQHWEKKEIQRREQQRIIVQQQQQQQQQQMQQQQASYFSQYPTSSTNNTAVTLSPQRFAFSQMAIAESTIDNTILPPLPILQQQQQQQLLAMNQQQQFLQQQQQLPHQSHHRASGVSGTLSELMSAAGQQSQHTTTSTGIIPKGLLSSVMEGHSDSATSASTNRQQLQQQLSSNNRNIIHNNFQEQTSQGSQSISTKDSRTLTSSYGHPTDALLASRSSKQVMAAPSSTTSSDMARMVEQQQHLLFPRGKCLTTPSEPASNNGHDNIDGNYIAYENDTITVSKKHIRIIRQNNSNKNDNAKSLTLNLDPNNVVDKSGNGNNKVRSATYRILSSAGQGTFAQVFQCLHVQTGKHVALKIVKNRPAYTRQAAIEIDIFQALQEQQREATPSATGASKTTAKRDYMVNLISYFMHENHLCLVFELLGLNLYDVLKRRQFRGLPLTMVRDIIRQSVEGVLELSRKNIVHCDLKPENILFVSNDIITYSDEGNKLRRQQQEGRSKVASASPATGNKSNLPPIDGKPTSNLIPDDTIQSPITMPDCQIKLIDFGSACFEGHTAHSYIQSRFYRCPEVLLGLPYDTAIDMWSLGCVAAELFVGLPILPGVHEHDQLVRITEMISKVPDWMLDQGAKSTKYYMKYVSRSNIETNLTAQPTTPGSVARTPSPAMSQSIPQWRLKTQQEFIESLTTSEILKKGGIEKLQKQPGNRYFKRTKLSDILSLHGRSTTGPDKDLVPAFVHFLYGVLDPDPWRRLTAFQAVQHPFITGELHLLRSKTDDIELNPKEENHANLVLDTYWPFPWDPAICRRKLLNVQKIREKQQAARRTMSNRPHGSLKSQVMMANHRSSSSAQQPQMNRDDNSIPDEHQQPQNVEPPVIRSSSPPNQISSSDSTNASNQIVFATRDRPNSSAMNIQSQSGANVNYLQENVGAISSQPQSYQLTGRTPTHAELALALERPGVVPGTYGIGGLSSSQSTPASYNQNAATPTVHNQFGPYNAYSLPSSGYGSMNESFGSTEYNQMSNVPHLTSSTVLDSQRDARNNYMNTSGQNPSLSMMPGAMATHQPFVDAQQVALLQQQQHIMMMQQQQQQLTMLQSQQQMGMYSTPFQQPSQTIPLQAQAVQQTQFMMPPQQPMMMANAPNGGFYYVMTSPTGQPILLQPVGTLNQPDFHPQMGVNINPMDGQQHPLFMQQPTMTVPQQQQPQMNPGGYFEQQNMPQMNYGFPQPQQQPQQPQQYSSRPSRNVSRHSRRGGTSM